MTRTISRESIAASLAADKCLELFSDPHTDPLFHIHTIHTTPCTLPNPSSPCIAGDQVSALQHHSEVRQRGERIHGRLRPTPTQQQGQQELENTSNTDTIHDICKYFLESFKYFCCGFLDIFSPCVLVFTRPPSPDNTSPASPV